MEENLNGEELKEIVRHECGTRTCKCGDCDCEYGSDFFNEDSTPTREFGNDDDLLQKQQAEAASDYANLTGAEFTENGEIKYRNTAEYRMIDPDGESVDSSKS